jgi:hypothetical protein
MLMLATRPAYLGKKPNDTHVTVEVFLNKQWILQDPTFNIHWQFEGEPLNIFLLRQIFIWNPFAYIANNFTLKSASFISNLSGIFYALIPQADSDGFPVDSVLHVSLDTYYLPYPDLLDYIIAYKVNINENTANPDKLRAFKTYPKDMTPYATQKQFNLNEKAYSKFKYETLAKIKWNFVKQEIVGWSTASPNTILVKNSFLSGKKGLAIYTDNTNYDYQLISAPLFCMPGNYMVIIKGSFAGKMSLLVQDAATQRLVPGDIYYFTCHKNEIFYYQFQLKKAKSIQIVLRNNSLSDESANWDLRKVELAQLDILHNYILNANPQEKILLPPFLKFISSWLPKWEPDAA